MTILLQLVLLNRSSGQLGPGGNRQWKRREASASLVFCDFSQAATLNQGQADDFLDVVEAIIDRDVDWLIDAFKKRCLCVD